MPVQRVFCSPIKWVRTARNADIGSSTSMTARLCSSSRRPETEMRARRSPPTPAMPRKSLAKRSFSMNVMSPGPASPTGRAERIDTLPSPTKRP